MASQELRAFLSSIDSRYVDHADAIHKGEFTNQAELAAADRTDLEKLGIPKGAAGLIIAAAGGKGDHDDKLSEVLANTEQLKAILPALKLMANPFQSASSLTSVEAQQQASDFKSRVFKYYFSPPPPHGLQQLPSQAYVASGKMTCMVSKLRLSSNLVEAAHILPKASAQVLLMFGMSAKAFFGQNHLRRSCLELQQHTFGEYDGTDLLMPSGNMPFRRTLAAHAAISVTAQQHNLRTSLSADDFDIVSDYEEKGTTAAWVQASLATAITSPAVL
ncbi:MAG: hypothetical protein FRX49_00357 [Trebouxia sp. A1-2]|nr:MAG: hypothetical protein FRX49_00357 [Trebouxia sp. A1-2]